MRKAASNPRKKRFEEILREDDDFGNGDNRSSSSIRITNNRNVSLYDKERRISMIKEETE